MTTPQVRTSLRRPIKPEKPRTIAEIAAEAVKQADGDALQATEIMTERVLNDPVLYRQLMDPMVRNACYEAVSLHFRRSRQVIWNSKQPSAEESRNRVEALAAGTYSSLLDFPLPGGLALRNATKEDLKHAASFYQEQSNDMGVKARWLKLIEKQVPPHKTVAETLDDEKLTDLKRQAEQG